MCNIIEPTGFISKIWKCILSFKLLLKCLVYWCVVSFINSQPSYMAYLDWAWFLQKCLWSTVWFYAILNNRFRVCVYFAVYCWADSEQDSSRNFAWSGNGRFRPRYLCFLRCSWEAKEHQIQPHTGRSNTFLCKAAVHVWLIHKCFCTLTMWTSLHVLQLCVHSKSSISGMLRICWTYKIPACCGIWKLVGYFIRFGRFGSHN